MKFLATALAKWHEVVRHLRFSEFASDDCDDLRLAVFGIALLPVDELPTPIAGRLNAGTFGAEQTVEPREVRLEVGQRPLVVHRVLDRAAPERNPAMRQCRQVVAGVRVCSHPVVEHHRRPAGERMCAEQQRRHGADDAEADQFPRVVVLRDPDVDARVPVVY